jgi:hypothetical protein
MSQFTNSYCLDTNVLIVAWNSYYSPDICPTYWDVLSSLGRKGLVYIPQAVAEEITRSDDELSHWLLNSDIPIQNYTEDITRCLSYIYESHPSHKHLVDNVKQRSLADPWVIAHALSNKSCVVTKETMVISPNPKSIRIPNVCANLKLKCITDFEMIGELNINFHCSSD